MQLPCSGDPVVFDAGVVASMLLWRAGILPDRHPERPTGEAGERLIAICCVAHWSKAMLSDVYKHLQVLNGAIPISTMSLIQQIQRRNKLRIVDEEALKVHPAPTELLRHLPNQEDHPAWASVMRIALAAGARLILIRDASLPEAARQAIETCGIRLCTPAEVMDDS